MKAGTVYLVGAGCGAADLITVRGLTLLQTCDVVVYDDLIAEDLLAAAPPDAERIYVGKRSGKHSAAQSEICELLVCKAQEGKDVVRLKGGDPFVFGRGGEEMEALLNANILCEVVPGISSAIAIPEEAGIPVTHRGVSQSVHIITAHTADTEDGLPVYLSDLARLPGTLVFLMGLRQLTSLAQKLIDAGKAADTPAAVISGGNARQPVTVRGTLRDIAEKAQDAQPPAVIVVGTTAALRFKAPVTRPLQGVTVGVTGTDVVTEKLRRALMPLGASTFLAERSAIEELPVSLEMLCDGPRWLVFTSANGVRVFFKKVREQKLDLRRFHICRFAVIGTATAAALAEYGIQADLCPQTATSEALARELLDRVSEGEEICLLRSVKGNKALFQTLMVRYPTRDISLYDLKMDKEAAQRAESRIEGMNYLTFSSASGVELYFEAHGAVPERTTCVCIGESTASALRQHHVKKYLLAKSISVRGMVDIILENEC